MYGLNEGADIMIDKIHLTAVLFFIITMIIMSMQSQDTPAIMRGVVIAISGFAASITVVLTLLRIWV